MKQCCNYNIGAKGSHLASPPPSARVQAAPRAGRLGRWRQTACWRPPSAPSPEAPEPRTQAETSPGGSASSSPRTSSPDLRVTKHLKQSLLLLACNGPALSGASVHRKVGSAPSGKRFSSPSQSSHTIITLLGQSRRGHTVCSLLSGCFIVWFFWGGCFGWWTASFSLFQVSTKLFWDQ